MSREYKTGSLRAVPVTMDADYRIEAIYAKDASGAIVCWQFFDYCASWSTMNPPLRSFRWRSQRPHDGRKFIDYREEGGRCGRQAAGAARTTAYVKTDKYGLWSADAKTE